MKFKVSRHGVARRCDARQGPTRWGEARIFDIDDITR